MKTRLRYLIVAFALVAALSTMAATDTRNYRAHLNGDGAGVETLAQGEAIFQFNEDGTELHYKLIVANIDNLWMAHIHLSPTPGANGPIIVWLYPDAPPPPAASIEGRFQGVLAEGTVTDADLVGLMAGKTLADLKQAMDDGLTYVNVHTNDFVDPPNTGPGDFPGGEVRGTIH
jgi:hypothetical protein